jgi:hypothetical protein
VSRADEELDRVLGDPPRALEPVVHSAFIRVDREAGPRGGVRERPARMTRGPSERGRHC